MGSGTGWCADRPQLFHLRALILTCGCNVFVYLLLSFVVVVVGMVALCVGALVISVPVLMISNVYVYLKLTGEQPRLAA
jgi:uncharacterized membrane protein